MPDGPLATYCKLCAAGQLRGDDTQSAAVARLDQLHHELADDWVRPGGLLARLGLGQAPPAAPRGLYLHGPVGRGKSMLMDLFYEAAPVAAKRRVHFHAFMLEVHRRLNDLRASAAPKADPLSSLARELATEARLLCFDELHVQNIADAMILGRLFEGLLEAGVVLVSTSNFAPDQLYEGGLNRERFLPCIQLLDTRLDVIALAGDTDYRLARLRDMSVYHAPLGPDTTARLEALFATLTDDDPGAPEEIAVGARRLTVPRAARAVAWFDFAELCEQPLGAADYLALTERYHTVILADVPQLTPDRRNEARRFVTLVDALYDRGVNLIVGAAAPPDALYPEGEGAFEFRRTVSRLMEMQSREYVLRPPRTGAAAAFAPFALTTDLI